MFVYEKTNLAKGAFNFSHAISIVDPYYRYVVGEKS